MEAERNTLKEFNKDLCSRPLTPDECFKEDTSKYWEHPDFIGLDEHAKPVYKKHYKCVGESDKYTAIKARRNGIHEPISWGILEYFKNKCK